MKHKLLFLSMFTLLAGMASAIPAQRGVWRTITLADGTELRAQLQGNSRLSWWAADDGTAYVRDTAGDYYVEVDLPALRNQTSQREIQLRQRQLEGREAVRAALRKGGPRRLDLGETGDFKGVKKGLVIMAEFQNRKFPKRHGRDFFQRVMTEEHFTSGEGFIGSVRDYFLDQSSGQFDLQIDVVGPVLVSKKYEYYGQNFGPQMDQNAHELVVEACALADSLVDFNDYDWDHDGIVDQVVVLYAGTGENYGAGEDYIWPHESSLFGMMGDYPVFDGAKLDSYAVVNEVKPTNFADGLGVFCHEFSHCMGVPDMYDIYYTGNYGMGTWDLLHSGGYLGDGFCPPNYTAYERYQAGWTIPTELTTDTIVTGMKPLSEGGETFIVRNPAHPDEYYLLENRSQTGWDTYIAAPGLLITYVDFDPEIWKFNIVNSTANTYSWLGYPDNDHERVTIFHADNNDDRATFNPETGGYSAMTEETDPYPIPSNNALTNTTQPAARLYHPNTDGTRLMNVEITDIQRNATDNTISFRFRNHNRQADAIAAAQTSTGAAPQARFSLSGLRLPADSRGLQLVRSADGTVRKTFVR